MGWSDFGPGLEKLPDFPDDKCDIYGRNSDIDSKDETNCIITYSNNPAHETYDQHLGLISTTGMYRYDKISGEGKVSRVVYNIKPNDDGKLERHILSQINYADIDTADCWSDNHPTANYHLRYMHTIASTKNYIIIPETSFTEDPCMYNNWNSDNFAELHHIPRNILFSIIKKY